MDLILDIRKDWTDKEWQDYYQALAETYESETERVLNKHNND